MTISKLAILVFLAAASIGSFAQTTPTWVPLAETDSFVWEGRVGSAGPTTTKGGVQVLVAEGRVTSKRDSRITFEKWYAKLEDCNAGSGKLVTLDMSGTYKFESDFVIKGGTVASSIAEMLCWVARERDDKGLRPSY